MAERGLTPETLGLAEWAIFGSVKKAPDHGIFAPGSFLSLLRHDELAARTAGEFEQAVALQAYADRFERRLLLPDEVEWADRGQMLEGDDD